MVNIVGSKQRMGNPTRMDANTIKTGKMTGREVGFIVRVSPMQTNKAPSYISSKSYCYVMRCAWQNTSFNDANELFVGATLVCFLLQSNKYVVFFYMPCVSALQADYLRI